MHKIWFTFGIFLKLILPFLIHGSCFCSFVWGMCVCVLTRVRACVLKSLLQRLFYFLDYVLIKLGFWSNYEWDFFSNFFLSKVLLHREAISFYTWISLLCWTSSQIWELLLVLFVSKCLFISINKNTAYCLMLFCVKGQLVGVCSSPMWILGSPLGHQACWQASYRPSDD